MHRVHLCGRHTQESTVPPETAARPAPIPRARSRKTAQATPACFESRRAQTGAAKNSVHTRTPFLAGVRRNNPKRCVLAFYFSKLVFKKGKSCHPIRNGSNCCPAGFAAHACKLRLATVRIVARRVRCPRLRQLREAAGAKPSGGDDDDDNDVFYALSAPGGAASRRLTPCYLKPHAPRRRLRRPLLLHCLQARRCCIFVLACSTPPPVHRLFCPSEGARRDSHHASAFTTGKAACLVVV